MARLIPLSQPGFRSARSAAFCCYALLGALLLPAQAPQARSITDDYVEWGSTIYPGWLAIDQAAMGITETAPLLLTPGRRCQNGKPVPVDRADWKQYVKDLVEVGKLARKTSQARNYEAFIDVSGKTERRLCELPQSLPRQGRHRRKWRHPMSTPARGEIKCA